MSIAVVGALFVAVVVPVFLAAGSPSAPARSPERLQGGSLAGPAGSFAAPPGSGSASDPAGATVATRMPRLVTLDLARVGERSCRVVEVLPRVPWNAGRYLEPTPREIRALQRSTASQATAPRSIVVAEPVT